MVKGLCAAALASVGLLAIAAAARAQPTVADDAAKFGTRQSVSEMRLSPDGKKIAYLQPGNGPSTGLFVQSLEGDAKPKLIVASSGRPDSLRECSWISNTRLSCTIYGVTKAIHADPIVMTRLIAVDDDGSNVRSLSAFSLSGIAFYGGDIIDRLPDQAGTVFIQRPYVGSVGSWRWQGLGVDRLDTDTMKFTSVESAEPGVSNYMSDGRGNVRIVALVKAANGQSTGIIAYRYRLPGSKAWRPLSNYDYVSKTGFAPAIIDRDRNRVYGYMMKDGRRALYTMSLDDTPKPELAFARDDVDVGEVQTIGPRQRVIGVSYSTDKSKVAYFDPELEKLRTSLSRAIPKQPIVTIVDATPDERKLLIFAGSDDDPGVYYLLDRDRHDLHILAASRTEMVGRTLAKSRPITYAAADGSAIPAYLTMPPGKEGAKGLPAIVMPHGGPEARDEWGFDYLAQYFAARGYAVIQPQYRGSAGYGVNWMAGNAFKSWRLAIGDVIDAGKWLVAQGIADPAKLAIVGWSYGGYAALQSEVVSPGTFKAIVAVAPVTDLDLLNRESSDFSYHNLEKERLGNTGGYREASPAQNAARFRAPVLLFHGTNDVDVGYHESVLMNERLKAAGKATRLVTYKDLGHQLDDSDARIDLLRQADAFLKGSMHL